MDLNRAQLIGNVTRDPESRATPSGQNVCSFSIATNSQWTDAQGQKQTRAEYHNIVAWGKLADICSQYLAKGRKVYVEGRLQTREYTTQDGQKRSRTEITAENMIILDRAGAGGATGSAASSGGFARPASNEPSIVPIPSSPQDGGMDRGVGEQEIRIEDIPF
ncbi:single-stranded DNA-binding protein [Patescibacteria group bacterium]|jgi:single-strand DNA-binding protein|nr:single-stranded DNA-binding protein [Patescibacteria group bacterium]MDQ5919448.1 single-strand DNA-binding protein [Patescibacteria group bacterium]